MSVAAGSVQIGQNRDCGVFIAAVSYSVANLLKKNEISKIAVFSNS